MLDIRKRILIVISLIVAIILAILLYYFFAYKKAQVSEEIVGESEEVTEETTEEIIGRLTETTTLSAEPTPFSEDVYAKQVAKIFVERFETYSNQNNNVHIEDVADLVTNKMSAWIKTREIEQSSEYMGVTTKVFASEVEEISDDAAKVVVEAQRLVESNEGEEVENISGIVELQKVNGDWKVDGLFWE